MQETNDAMMTEEQVLAFYTKSTDGIDHPVPLVDMIELSKDLSLEVEDYRHSNY